MEHFGAVLGLAAASSGHLHAAAAAADAERRRVVASAPPCAACGFSSCTPRLPPQTYYAAFAANVEYDRGVGLPCCRRRLCAACHIAARSDPRLRRLFLPPPPFTSATTAAASSPTNSSQLCLQCPLCASLLMLRRPAARLSSSSNNSSGGGRPSRDTGALNANHRPRRPSEQQQHRTPVEPRASRDSTRFTLAWAHPARRARRVPSIRRAGALHTGLRAGAADAAVTARMTYLPQAAPPTPPPYSHEPLVQQPGGAGVIIDPRESWEVDGCFCAPPVAALRFGRVQRRHTGVDRGGRPR
ncbi:hypothetical protein HK405_015643 [Cladochytrium tenue]|nr:hypothetical protein HK405_015643 [Cladochytrium tenue]